MTRNHKRQLLISVFLLERGAGKKGGKGEGKKKCEIIIRAGKGSP